MAKRIVTKIGDIFSVTLDNGNLRFFQYIANDWTDLNSSVIRVFKKEYPRGYELNPEEVVSDDVDFYAIQYFGWGWQMAIGRKLANARMSAILTIYYLGRLQKVQWIIKNGYGMHGT